ncbi:hypothetical protein BGW38_009971 [Lunasporangiospora selenospora]|uniref:TPR-like protein n=1 Tax=Lunasporangiospora selenospora TaxID=979761 RepID=A0A9P6FY26_9FUNG|nr:hypothetical protein BGW38_009971 [Lunasporangiospora selenospora]
MSLTPKAQAIEREFQTARGKANYATFPEFARRFVKHNKDGVVLANTALLEMAVGEAELATKSHQNASAATLDDTPESVAPLSSPIKSESIQPAIEKLEAVLAKGTEEHQEFAAIVLARSALATDASDRLQRVAHYLQNIQLPPARIPMGYNFALIVCGLTVKGITLEEEGRVAEAIVSYDNVSVLVQSNPNERSDELNSWVEQALYRAGMLKLRQGDQLAAIRSFRVYHSLALQWPSNFRLARRASVYRHLSTALSGALKTSSSNIANNVNGSSDEQSQFYPAALSVEIAQIHAYWEDALYAVTSFPKADEKNWRVLAMIEQIVEDRRLIGSGNDADKRALVETIYRASQKTFQSPRILRFLFFALVEMGQYDEAALALKAYLDMAEINQKIKIVSEDEELTHEQRVRQDIESEYDITAVMIAGSRLYGKELKKPTEALDCAERALKNIDQHLQQDDVKDLIFEAYKYKGIAHNLAASEGKFYTSSSQCLPIYRTWLYIFIYLFLHEPEKRPVIFAKAVECLEKAIEVQPLNFDGHYHLGLQLAEMRDVPKAIAVVKQSLNFNPSHIPSWHLLALLLSSQKEYQRALDICSVGLKESDWDLSSTDAFSASQLEGEDYLALRITQAVLHDQIHGAESALELQEGLFVLFTKVFAPEPGAQGESLYDIQNIRRRDPSDSELVSSVPTGGRPRAGSILSVRSRSGASDLGNGLGTNNGSTLDIPKPNYASSVTSIGSSGSKKKGKLTPPAAASAVNGSTQVRSHLGLPQTVQRATVKSISRTARANSVLATLWLMSASAFRRLERMEEALRAIEEAERVDASNPDVWYHLGLLYAAQDDQETASVSYSKALALAPYHTACLTRVGRAYLEAGSLEMAENALETTTKSQGWRSAEAWLYLGKVYEASDRLQRAKECLWYALDLEQSRPIREFADAVPRYLN